MKKLYTLLLTSISLLSFSQINVNAGFEVDNGGFTNVSFFRSKTTPVCVGSYGLIRNFWSGGTVGSTSYASTTSNGGTINISFRYRTFVYMSNTVGGTMKVEYSKDGGSTFTTLETVTLNSVISCTSWSGSIPQGDVPVGSNFIFRISGAYGSGDYYLILDEISLSQSTLATTEVANNNVKIFPNPAKNEFVLSSNLTNGKVTIEIYDASGKIAAKKEVISTSEIKFSADQLSNGVYTVKIKSAKGEQSQKLIVKK